MASGEQYVTHTGLTVMPASYADSSDWGKSSVTYLDSVSNTLHIWRLMRNLLTMPILLKGLHEEVFRNVKPALHFHCANPYL